MSASAVLVRDEPQFVESETGWLKKYPSRRWARWLFRLAIAAYLSVFSVAYQLLSGGDWSSTPNGAIDARMDTLHVGTGVVDVIAELVPLLTSVVALILPGGPFVLSLAGAAIAAVLLQLIVQALHRKRFLPAVRTVLMLALVVNPVFVFVATTNVEAALGLFFFGWGMLDLVRFVTWANTQAGFRAGMLFAAAAMSDTTLVFASLVAAAAGALIVQSRRGARIANAIVIVFPTLALFLSLVVLGTAFGAGPLSAFRGAFIWNQANAETLWASFWSVGGLVFFAPMVIVVVTAFGLRYTGVGLVAVLLTASTSLAFILGLTPPGSGGITYLLMLLLAIAIVPTPITRSNAALVSATAVLLWIVGLLTAQQWAVLPEWLGVVSGGML